MFPVPAARHPGVPHLFVYRRGPGGGPGRRGEQRDLALGLQPLAALLPGQRQRAPGAGGESALVGAGV